jgi:hypothetical protein
MSSPEGQPDARSEDKEVLALVAEMNALAKQLEEQMDDDEQPQD